MGGFPARGGVVEREREEETFRYTRTRFIRLSGAYKGTGTSMRPYGDSHAKPV
jgi:hypothetical protein